jgi:diguanylate cyclase (GGDEF)-like protein
VLKGLFEGMKNADIAKNLAIAEQTVKDHLSKVYKKMGVKNRFELMRSIVRAAGRKARNASTTHIPARLPAESGLTEVSLTDELTGMHNRRGFLTLAEQELKIAKRQKKKLCLLHAELEETAITDTSGPNGRDVLLRDAAYVLRETFRESDVMARVGADEFAVIPLGASEADADRVVARLRKNLEHFNSGRTGEDALSLSCGTTLCDPTIPCSADELVRADADKKKK